MDINIFSTGHKEGIYDNLSNDNLSNVNLSGTDLSGTDLRGTDLSYANLRYADLRYADLRYADLRNANLRYADLRYADLRNADLRNANLSNADLRCTDLSNTKGLVSAIDYIDTNFEKTTEGYFVYKTFGCNYTPNKNWKIKPNSIIEEVVDFSRQCWCGCGINVAPLEFVKNHYEADIWKCLIRFEWLAGVCVPYQTNGQIRCERIQLLEIIKP